MQINKTSLVDKQNYKIYTKSNNMVLTFDISKRNMANLKKKTKNN